MGLRYFRFVYMMLAAGFAFVGVTGIVLAIAGGLGPVGVAFAVFGVILLVPSAALIRLSLIGVRYSSTAIQVWSVFRIRTVDWRHVDAVRRARTARTLDSLSMVMSTIMLGGKPGDPWTIMIRTRDGEDIETSFWYIPGWTTWRQMLWQRPGLQLLSERDFDAVQTALQDALTASRQESTGS